MPQGYVSHETALSTVQMHYDKKTSAIADALARLKEQTDRKEQDYIKQTQPPTHPGQFNSPASKG